MVPEKVGAIVKKAVPVKVATAKGIPEPLILTGIETWPCAGFVSIKLKVYATVGSGRSVVTKILSVPEFGPLAALSVHVAAEEISDGVLEVTSSITAEKRKASLPAMARMEFDAHELGTLFRRFAKPDKVRIGLHLEYIGILAFIDTVIVLLSQGIIEF